ncbi:MAG: hypothetical protein FWF02_10185 [Micrococcales bacterium]|nr:hypothetical protein [Micrococcales bacterium]MCL2668054.1 hypothetical protein [Micrococcales bacterium]
MRRAAVVCAAPLVLLVGCTSGTGTGTGTPPTNAWPTSTVTAAQDPAIPVVAINLCDDLPEVLPLCLVSWDHYGEPEWITLSFGECGVMSWSIDYSRAEGTGTWTFDGDGTVSVHLDTPIPQAPTSDLSLEFGTVQNGCGDGWVALVDPALLLHFDPQGCE